MAAVQYRIDADDRIVAVSPAWTQFARANASEHLEGPAIVGQPLWGHVTDPTTVELYRGMVARLRAGSGPIEFRFRCDAPARRRLMRMHMQRGDGDAVDFTVTPVAETPRPAVALLDSASPRGERLVTICGWCKRVRLAGDRWVEVEEAIEALELLDGPPWPALSHGICPDCYRDIIAVLGEDERRPA